MAYDTEELLDQIEEARRDFKLSRQARLGSLIEALEDDLEEDEDEAGEESEEKR